MAYRFVEGKRIHDWVCYCAICGSKTWATDTQVLGIYTGRGGLRVCPDCVDVTDYGLVPYKIPAEKPVPYSNYLLPAGIGPQVYPPFDYTNYNPVNTNPNELLTIDQNRARIDVDPQTINIR